MKTTKQCAICGAVFTTHVGAEACALTHRTAAEQVRAQAVNARGRRSQDAGR
jgi:hypothetical protein